MTMPATTPLLGFGLADGARSRKLRPVDGSAGDDREALLRDPELRKDLETVIRGRVSEGDIEDVLQETFAAISVAAALPEDPAERRQYMRAIARKQAAEHRRKSRREVSVEDGVDVDGSPALAIAATESVANRDLLAKIVQAVPGDHDSTLRCFARHALGESLAEIAREVGVDYDVLYKRVTTLQRRMRATGMLLAGITILMVAIGAAWSILHPKPQIAHEPPAVAPTSAPATSTSADGPTSEQTPERDPLAEARELRSKAFEECTRNAWRDCLTDLAAASALDHAGDSDPLVEAARRDAQNGLGDKPSSWRPALVRSYAPKKGP